MQTDRLEFLPLRGIDSRSFVSARGRVQSTGVKGVLLMLGCDAPRLRPAVRASRQRMDEDLILFWRAD